MLTADACALVCVWSIINGDKLMEFNANLSAEYVERELTAMRFDMTYRRLVTALNDGSISIWNFNNGNCLRQVYGHPVLFSVCATLLLRFSTLRLGAPA